MPTALNPRNIELAIQYAMEPMTEEEKTARAISCFGPGRHIGTVFHTSPDDDLITLSWGYQGDENAPTPWVLAMIPRALLESDDELPPPDGHSECGTPDTIPDDLI
ncbi:hypothetical protein [Nocardia nova]|uniref:hypothetical protein n=1 Tax=Nocardia nova TaxID=37330 RepID=UPI0033D0AD83